MKNIKEIYEKIINKHLVPENITKSLKWSESKTLKVSIDQDDNYIINTDAHMLNQSQFEKMMKNWPGKITIYNDVQGMSFKYWN